MKIAVLTLLAISFSMFMKAQTKPPESRIASKTIQAFSTNNLDELSVLLPQFAKAHPEHVYTVFFKAYLADVKDNNVNEALKGYSQVIKMAPDIMEAYFFRCRIFFEKGMYEKALDDITNAIRYDTYHSSNLYTTRAEIYERLSRMEAAYDDFYKAIELDPSNEKNYRGLLNVGLLLDRKEAIATIFQRAVQGIQSNNAGVWEVWGDFLLRTKQYAAADVAYDQSFRLPYAAPSADSYNNAAIAALNTGNFSKAKRLAEKAVAINPKGYLYYCTRSEISIYDKTWEEVYTWAQKALLVNSKSARVNKLMSIGVKFTNRGEALSNEYDAKSKKYESEGYH